MPRLEVNRVIGDTIARRYGFFSVDSYRIFHNYFAMAGLLFGLFLTSTLLFGILWYYGLTLEWTSIAGILFSWWFILIAIVLVVVCTGFVGRYGLGLARDLLERRERLNELVSSAETDPLSGLYNRRSFLRELEKEINRYNRGVDDAGVVGVIFLDIDFFKKINDTYGHAAGDEVICQLARHLEQNCRPYDVVGRWGGEEFVIMTPDSSIDQAKRFAERIRASVETLELRFEYQFIHYTISIGVATYETPEETMDQFIQRADDMLYRSKESGRNRVTASEIKAS